MLEKIFIVHINNDLNKFNKTIIGYSNYLLLDYMYVSCDVLRQRLYSSLVRSLRRTSFFFLVEKWERSYVHVQSLRGRTRAFY